MGLSGAFMSRRWPHSGGAVSLAALPSDMPYRIHPPMPIE
jgi:hypothetical protein